MRTTIQKLSFFFILLPTFMVSCVKDEYKIPDPISAISNDVIKRSIGPNIVTLPIEFVYAVAIPSSKGKLSTAQVEASIEGAAGTFLENRSFYTNTAGIDVPVTVGSPSVKDGKISKVAFTVDTNAAALRYYYIIPDEARGKSVSFTFSVTGSDGKSATYKMGPYEISKMDIKRNIAVSNNNLAYVSVANMAVYTAANAVANAAKIDLVYLYRATPAAFLHGLVSPAAEAIYLPGVTLPSGVTNNSKVRREFALQDRNLAQMQFGIYIDDKDFQEVDLKDVPNYAIGLRAEAGAWVETADKKYRAYIFVNSVNVNGSAVISMLRYPL